MVIICAGTNPMCPRSRFHHSKCLAAWSNPSSDLSGRRGYRPLLGCFPVHGASVDLGGVVVLGPWIRHEFGQFGGSFRCIHSVAIVWSTQRIRPSIGKGCCHEGLQCPRRASVPRAVMGCKPVHDPSNLAGSDAVM
jgi:hypothetical protein